MDAQHNDEVREGLQHQQSEVLSTLRTATDIHIKAKDFYGKIQDTYFGYLISTAVPALFTSMYNNQYERQTMLHAGQILSAAVAAYYCFQMVNITGTVWVLGALEVSMLPLFVAYCYDKANSPVELPSALSDFGNYAKFFSPSGEGILEVGHNFIKDGFTGGWDKKLAYIAGAAASTMLLIYVGVPTIASFASTIGLATMCTAGGAIASYIFYYVAKQQMQQDASTPPMAEVVSENGPHQDALEQLEGNQQGGAVPVPVAAAVVGM